MISVLVEKLKKEKEAKIILTGDFNSLPKDRNIQYLLNEFVDVSTISKSKPYGEKGTWNGFDFNKITEKQIDFIFIKKNLN
jgi:endonuclease/exonuclease/phosphatase family metal-dependent hydrolase